MKAIWKFPLKVQEEQWIKMPYMAEILTVQIQDGQPMLWATVRTGDVMSERRILTFGTGNPCETHGSRYIATYQVHGGSLVYHVFEGDVQ